MNGLHRVSHFFAKKILTGYQYAAEAIYAYDIYSNSDRIQNITRANYEWFLLRNSVQPESKINSDTYATLEKIRRRDPFVPGAYVDLSKLEKDKPIIINLRVKIPLNSFLLLRQFPLQTCHDEGAKAFSFVAHDGHIATAEVVAGATIARRRFLGTKPGRATTEVQI